MSGDDPRVTVYVAREPFVKTAADGYYLNARASRLVIESHPAIAHWPDEWRVAGTVDTGTAAMIDVLDDEATLVRLWEHIQPVMAETAEIESADAPIGPRGSGLTRSEILAARREWQAEGPPAPWWRLGVSEATFFRHRRRYQLIPWPAGYRVRLTP